MITPVGREWHRPRRQLIIQVPVHARGCARHTADKGDMTTLVVTITAWKRTSMTKRLGGRGSQACPGDGVKHHRLRGMNKQSHFVVGVFGNDHLPKLHWTVLRASQAYEDVF